MREYDEEYEGLCSACDHCVEQCVCADPDEEYEQLLQLRGTSECDGLCLPTCDWCLAAHVCPDHCGGEDDCPYLVLATDHAEGAA